MRINSTYELGLYVRERRRDLGLTQADLAAEARVSRRWLSDLEGGKETAEVGLVLRTLATLNLAIDLQRLETLKRSGPDLDDLLRKLGARDA